jgi:OmcA/MtrC family decaheme c-type cytochrome
MPGRLTLLFVLLVGSVLLVSAPTPTFTVHDKAYYAEAAAANFIRPGLVTKILSAEIAPDGTIKARFRLTDPKGQPLDREGIVTPGPVSISFIASYIPSDQSQYVAYTTRVQTSPITKTSAIQAGTDAGGVFEKVGDGEYVYTFRTKAPVNFDATATHSIGAYSSRDLTEFDLGTQFADNVFTFAPNGSKVTKTREVIRTATCNKCHDPLSAHGGARRSVELCILCHTPQTTDPDTGNTVDLKVMVHKIHAGVDLPSVKAGKPYQIIGFNQSVNDFSTVAFPADVRNCQFCHEQGPAQANAFLAANRAACGSCHDNVNFATGEGHVDLPQVSDNQCSQCHIPQGELEFDASIKGAHTIPRFSRDLPGTVFQLVRVDDGLAGKHPTVTFTLKDKSGKPILPSDMGTLNLVLAGPTSDYASAVSEDARKATGSPDGTYFYTFQQAIPNDAKGTYSIGIEGRRAVKLLAGTKKEMTVNDAGANQVIHFPVSSSNPEPRRTVVAIENCNSCHSSLSVHGDLRNRTEMCVLCHNPNQTDQARRPASEGPPQSVDFRTMVHKIHTGEDLTSEYTIYGFGASKNDFTEVRFPGDRRDCGKCHVNGSEQLPLRDNLLAVNNPRGLMNPTGPTAAACLGCHTQVFAASHALANTTTLGESCATCHGTNADFSVNRVHAR